MKFISLLADILLIFQRIAGLILSILQILEKLQDFGLLISYRYESPLDREI